jgi:hypothetical protein
MCRICHQGVHHQTMSSFKKRHRRKKSIKIIRDQPTSTPLFLPLHRLTDAGIRESHQQIILTIPLGLTTLGTGSPSQLRTGITDLREDCIRTGQAPPCEARPSPSGSPTGLIIIRCNPKIRWASTSTTLFYHHGSINV